MKSVQPANIASSCEKRYSLPIVILKNSTIMHIIRTSISAQKKNFPSSSDTTTAAIMSIPDSVLWIRFLMSFIGFGF